MNLNIRTRHGLLVRSGIERTIAEFLTDNGIKFKYEDTLILEGMKFHPDFYLEDIDIYLEHWGLDEPGYLEYRKKKEDIYRRNNIQYISTEKTDVNEIYEKLKYELGKYMKKDWK